MKYELTKEQYDNRQKMFNMTCLLRSNPKKYKLQIYRNQHEGLTCLVYTLFSEGYYCKRVVIKEIPNNFPWKWKQKCE